MSSKSLFKLGMWFLRWSGAEATKAWDGLFYQNKQYETDLAVMHARHQRLKDAFRDLLGSVVLVDGLLSSQNPVVSAQAQLRVAILQARNFEKML